MRRGGGKNADDLRPEARTIERAGHHPEQIAAVEVDNAAQQLPAAAFGKRDHRVAHQVDARLVVEPLADFGGIDEADPISHPRRFRRGAGN